MGSTHAQYLNNSMIGTHPTFYLVPVTKELSGAVMIGQWPKVETKVLRCVTVAGH